MPKHRRFDVALALLAAVTGCSLIVNPLPKLWFYTYGTGTPEGKDTLLNPASFLELRPDGSYTRDFGGFEYGTWIKKERQIVLTSHEHQITSLPFSMPSPGDMQVSLAGGYIADFEGRAIPAQRMRTDPFSLENNRWRIHPIQKETDAEIRKRLHDHCEYWVAYFRWALDKGFSSIDVRSTPTCIKIYNNGFTLKPAGDLPMEWVSYFYDAVDCQKASDMIREIFQHKTIAWANTDNKFKMYISAFQQIANYLR